MKDTSRAARFTAIAIIAAVGIAGCAGGPKAKDDDARALMKRAKEFVKVRRYQDARRALAQASELSPGSYEIQREYLKLLGREGGEVARSHVNALLEKRPREPLPYLLMSQLEEETERKTKWVDDALALDPAFSWALLEKAKILLAQGDSESAAGLLKKSLASPDVTAEASFLLADALTRAGSTEEAERILESLSLSHQDEAVRDEASGELFSLLWERDRRKAASLADRLLETSHDPFLFADIAWVFSETADFLPKSVDFFERAIAESDTLTLRRLYPMASPEWLEERSEKNRGFFGESLGGICLKLGRNLDAVRVLERAKADLRDPTNELLFSLARAYEVTGHRDEAIDVLVELLSAQVDRTAGALLDSLYMARHGSLAGLSEKIEEARKRFSKEAPDFKLPTADGEKFSLRDLRGKVVYLAFWFPT